MTHDPVNINNNVVVPGVTTAIVPPAPEPPKPETPPAVEQSAKIILNVIALLCLFLCVRALIAAVVGTDDREIWGVLQVWDDVFSRLSYYDPNRNTFLWFTAAILPVTSILVYALFSAVAEKKTPMSGLALIIMLTALYCAAIPHFVVGNPASVLLHVASQEVYGAELQLVTGWRYLVYSGGFLGVSLKIWSSL